MDWGANKAFWTDFEKTALEQAKTFEELLAIALRVILRMPRPIEMVCGPITTGGAGSIEKNIKRLKFAIMRLAGRGRNIFDQTPFEDQMQAIKETPYYQGGDHLLESFYLPLFGSGLVKALNFLPDWESSYGATWERERAIELGIEIRDLKDDFFV